MSAVRKNKKINYAVRRFALTSIILVVCLGGIWLLLDKTGVLVRVSDLFAATSEPEPEPEPVSSAIESEPEPPPSSTIPPPPDSSIWVPEPVASEAEPVPAANPDDEWRLMLVSAANPLREGYSPELEVVSENYAVDSRIADNLRTMIAEARLEGITLMICSAFRTPEYQQTLFDRQVDYYKNTVGQSEEQAVATAATIVAYPGTSEHHTGLAVDVITPEYQVLDEGFANTPAAKWMAANSWKYGFIIRYPKDKQDITKIIYEPWHLRYVGEEHAKIITEKGYCLEEYLYLEFRQQAGLSAQSAPDVESPAAELPENPDINIEDVGGNS